MTVFYAKVGDTIGDLTAELVDDDGVAVDISGATVAVLSRPGRGAEGAQALTVSGPATVVDGPAGLAKFDLTAAHTTLRAQYRFSWVVTFPGNSDVQSFPNQGFDLLVVSDH